MRTREVAVIGGGPAGLSAAISAASCGTKVVLLEREDNLGGQLKKQTHKFFGSKKQYASTRGFDIGNILEKQIEEYRGQIEVLTDAIAIGYYEDGVLSFIHEKNYRKIKPERLIVATGASEKFLAFPNNDLPGIYGAGAVQTLMNEYGIKPGNNVLMVGAGNIGLIVSYQLMQAGVNVKAIIDAAPRIGGYLVHASKIRRRGVPILVSHTIKYAHGTNFVEGATIWELDENWQPIYGTEKDIDVDLICISVGLSPIVEFLWQAGCEMKYVGELGGHVPIRDRSLKTTIDEVYVAGDAAGIEEASSSMVEGRLAGISAAISLGYDSEEYINLREDYIEQLNSLRNGPVGEKILQGLDKVLIGGFENAY